MNFASHSVKNKATRQCASFSLDIEMPKGHFFAVLDFTSHDYANLDASLTAKLQTIAGSFTSVSSFSADLFLGFMAKEINNFVHNLAEQSGGPALRCSAALSWLDGNTFSHLLRGDATISVRNGEHTTQIATVRGAKLGSEHFETPVSGEVETSTLKEDDVVFMMTNSVAEVFVALPALNELDTEAMAASLLQSAEYASGDGAFVVISGPYAPPLDAVSANELRSTVAALEARLNALASAGTSGDETTLASVRQIDDKFGQTIAELKEHLSNKPSTLDFLELDEKVKSLGSLLTGKAENAEVLDLRRELMKFDAAAKENAAVVAEPQVVQTRSGSLLTSALLLLVLAAGAGFLGSWLSLRRVNNRPEVWSVKTSGSEISLRREDVNSEAVTLSAGHALTAGEQKFSSFSDAQRYIASVTSMPSAQSSANQIPSAAASSPAIESTAEITIKPGDSLKKIAKLYNVPEEKVKALNPEIKRWELIQSGQKVVVPSALPTASPSPTPTANETAATTTPAVSTEVTVGPGDSLNELARRFNTTAARLKELNPQMNWPRIHVGQKVTVPAGG
jgi:LysM repeat protein